MTANELRAKRMAAGVPGSLVCLKAGIGRSRLSDIERGYVTVSSREREQLLSALDELTNAREAMMRAAREAGWPSEVLNGC